MRTNAADTRAYQHKWYLENRERTAARAAERRKTPEVRARDAAIRAIRKAKDPALLGRMREYNRVYREKAKRDPASRRGEIVERNQFERLMQKKYGLTLHDWANMWESQAGKCKTCSIEMYQPGMGKPRGRTSAVVDHCHATGRVRGLLCSICNTLLGMLELRGLDISNFAAYAAIPKE